MTLWTGFKQQNCASDNKIGPNEENRRSCKKNSSVLSCINKRTKEGYSSKVETVHSGQGGRRASLYYQNVGIYF